MKLLCKLGLLASLSLTTLSANAELYSFSYTFDGSDRGTAGHILTGVIDGTMQEDGDTIIINDFLSASLFGHAYDIGDDIGIRAAEVAH